MAVATFANSAQADFAENWLAHLGRVGLRQSALVGVTDDAIVGDDELAALSEEFAPMIVQGGISAIDATKAEVRDGDHIDLPRIVFEFDKYHWSMLRRLIDRLNENAPT